MPNAPRLPEALEDRKNHDFYKALYLAPETYIAHYRDEAAYHAAFREAFAALQTGPDAGKWASIHFPTDIVFATGLKLKNGTEFPFPDGFLMGAEITKMEQQTGLEKWRWRFDDEIEWQKRTFDFKLHLSKATFSGDADFLAATFSGNAAFGAATFSGNAAFGAVTFSGFANFDAATFSGNAAFDAATFSGNAAFDAATFLGDAAFGAATFSGNANFYAATFSGNAAFGTATFSGFANFGAATFSGDAAFYAATFSGNANFGAATFSGDAAFGAATFSGDAAFGAATFSGDANFGAATFSGDAAFGAATFSGDAYFGFLNAPTALNSAKQRLEKRIAALQNQGSGLEGEEQKRAYRGLVRQLGLHLRALENPQPIFHFKQTLFLGDVSFGDSTFAGAFSFEQCFLQNGVSFQNATFSERAVFEAPNPWHLDTTQEVSLAGVLKTFGQPSYHRALAAQIRNLQSSIQRLESITLPDLDEKTGRAVGIPEAFLAHYQGLQKDFEKIKGETSPDLNSFADKVQAFEKACKQTFGDIYHTPSSIRHGLTLLQGYVRRLQTLKTLMTLPQARPFPVAKLIFDRATFGNEVHDRVEFRHIQDVALSFVGVNWGTVPRFVSVNFAQAILRDTDWRTALFQSCRWPKRGGRVQIEDEAALEPDAPSEQRADVEELYRQLKQNYEDRREFATAGEFHFSEKEMRLGYLKQLRREQKGKSVKDEPQLKWDLGVLYAYRFFSRYGERWTHILLMLFWLTVLMPIIYLSTGLQVKDKDFIPVTRHVSIDWGGWQEYMPNPHCRVQNCPDVLAWHPITQEYQANGRLADIGYDAYWKAYGHALNHSAKFILPFQEKFYVPIGFWGSFWSGLHVLLAPLLALLLGTAIRQKLKR